MKWSILVLTQDSRSQHLDRLLTILGPQVAKVHDQVEILVRHFDMNRTLGDNRQQMVQDATGEYLNFIDDDDLVPFDYVAKILPKLDGKVDFIGYKVDVWIEGKRHKPSIHSLKYAEWTADQTASYRNISHINPIRSVLAKQAQFEGGRAEDHRWAKQLTALGIVRTEYFLDEFLYVYEFTYRKGAA